MPCAVIDLGTGLVLNTIVADASIDNPFPGTIFVDTDEPVGSGWRWTPWDGFIPPPAYAEALRLNAEREAQKPFMLDEQGFVTAVAHRDFTAIGEAWGNIDYRFRDLPMLWHLAQGRSPIIEQ